jgi:pimeloyl-ACP methyl ester carboxylesterase
MIHGYRGDHHGLQLFADALPEYRVIIPDLPSFGLSGTWPHGVRSIDDFGRWLRAFLESTGTTSAAVLGHSFGSIVVAHGLKGTRREPIILVNPISQKALTGPKKVLAALGASWYVLGGKLPERWGRAFLSWPLIVRVMSGLLAKTTNPGLRRWIHEQHGLYFSSFSDRDSLIGGYTISTTHDVSDVAAEVHSPVLLVVAAQDDITPLDAQRKVQGIFPDATLAIIDGVGHLVHYEKPLEAAGFIRDFLKNR